MIDRAHHGYSRGPVPCGAQAEALAVEQRRLADIAAIYRRYQLAYGGLDFVADGQALHVIAIRDGWSPGRLLRELSSSVEAWPELLDVQGGAEVEDAGPPVCFQRGPCLPDGGPGRLFTMGSI